MIILTPLFTSFQTEDGKRLKLDELVLSRGTIRNTRIEQRNILAEQEIEKFKQNMPRYLSLGWDGKMMMTFLSNIFSDI